MQGKLILAAAVAAAISGTAFADGAKLFQEKTCWSCHGKDAKTPLLPAYPKLAGQNKAYIEQQMKDIKSGARANGNSAAMAGIMVIVDDADIPQLADYLSKLKP
jgi:cytochrome c